MNDGWKYTPEEKAAAKRIELIGAVGAILQNIRWGSSPNWPMVARTAIEEYERLVKETSEKPGEPAPKPEGSSPLVEVLEAGIKEQEEAAVKQIDHGTEVLERLNWASEDLPRERWQDMTKPFVRRYRFKLPVTMTIEVDVHTEADHSAARVMINQLVEAIATDPQSWQRTMLRLYPEIIRSIPTGPAEDIHVVGPGIGDELERQQQRERDEWVHKSKVQMRAELAEANSQLRWPDDE